MSGVYGMKQQVARPDNGTKRQLTVHEIYNLNMVYYEDHLGLSYNDIIRTQKMSRDTFERNLLTFTEWTKFKAHYLANHQNVDAASNSIIQNNSKEQQNGN